MIPTANRSASSTNIDLTHLKLDSQRRLLDLLDKFEGTKIIVWDDRLIGPFEFVANASILRKHDAIRLMRLSDIKLVSSDADYILFFLRKDVQFKQLADSLNRIDRVALSKSSLVFVPHRCMSIEKALELNKVDLSKFYSIEELNIELFALDNDILSMENQFVYRDVHLNEDHSAIHQIVESLIKFQATYGQIPKVCGQGKAAKLVFDLLLKRRKLDARSSSQPRSVSPKVHQLVLIDRRIDLITPLITQLTYEGLLDEIFGIHSGVVTLASEKFNKIDEKQKDKTKNSDSKTPKKIELRSTEDLFAKLRDCHINAVADTLKQSAKKLQSEYDECNSEGKTIHEMSKIVKRLQHLKNAKSSQSNHVAIAELVNEQTLKPEFIYGLRIEHEILQEDGINRIIPNIDLKLLRQEPVMNIIRLICIQSLVNNGLKPKVCDYYKQEIIQNYGHEYLILLMQLEKANVLLNQERFYDTGNFNQLRTKFGLINDNFEECNPNHFSYVYGGYAPISVVASKILAQFNQTQWRSLSENLKILPEPTVTHLDESPGSNSTIGQVYQSSTEDTKVVMVFFIGGCTFAEISALRFLAQQEDNNCEFIIGTTSIINGKTFLNSLWPLGYEGAKC